MVRAEIYRKRGAQVGMSVLETLFVLGILIMLGATLAPLLTRTYSSARSSNAADEIASLLGEARSRSRGNFQDTSHGVYINTAASPVSLTLYQGANYTVRNTSKDQITTLQNGTTVSLSPFTADIHFAGSVGTTSPVQLTVNADGNEQILILTDGGFIYEE